MERECRMRRISMLLLVFIGVLFAGCELVELVADYEDTDSRTATSDIVGSDDAVMADTETDSVADTGIDAGVTAATDVVVIADTDTGIDSAVDTDIITAVDTDNTGMVCDRQNYTVKDGGYICAGELHGYAWTSPGEVDGASMEPVDFSDTKAGESLCVAGVTAASYDSVGILGINANQALGSVDSGVLYPDAEDNGFSVSVSRQQNFTLRFYLTAEDGELYCTDIADGDTEIRFHDLRTECWGAEGEPYNGTDGITAVMLLVPGDEARQWHYSFCLNELTLRSFSTAQNGVDTETEPATDGPPVDGTDGDTAPDTDTVTEADTVVDTGTDTTVDTGEDSGVDTGEDTGVDTAPPQTLCDVPGYSVDDGGYVCTGPLHGYAWVVSTGGGSAFIEPNSFSSLVAGDSLCVEGANAASYNAVGVLGINVNQPIDDYESDAWVPDPDDNGFSIMVTTQGSFPFRLVIETTSGASYCSALSAGVNHLGFADLQTKCWEEGTTPYNGSDPIQRLMLMVPGDEMSVVYYSFCLDELSVF